MCQANNQRYPALLQRNVRVDFGLKNEALSLRFGIVFFTNVINSGPVSVTALAVKVYNVMLSVMLKYLLSWSSTCCAENVDKVKCNANTLKFFTEFKFRI